MLKSLQNSNKNRFSKKHITVTFHNLKSISLHKSTTPLKGHKVSGEPRTDRGGLRGDTQKSPSACVTGAAQGGEAAVARARARGDGRARQLAARPSAVDVGQRARIGSVFAYCACPHVFLLSYKNPHISKRITSAETHSTRASQRTPDTFFWVNCSPACYIDMFSFSPQKFTVHIILVVEALNNKNYLLTGVHFSKPIAYIYITIKHYSVEAVEIFKSTQNIVVYVQEFM